MERAALGGDTMWEGGTAGPEWAKTLIPTLLGRTWSPPHLPHCAIWFFFLIPSLLPVKTLQPAIP